MFAVFAILQAPVYTRLMGFQILMWSYYRDVRHPFLQILDRCPSSLVAEDIELSLMILSNYTATTNLSRDSDPLHDCYQKLSLLMHVANKVRDYRISQFGGATLQRSRLQYTEDSVNTQKVRDFVESWIENTAANGLWEYKRPRKTKLVGQVGNTKIPKKSQADQSAQYSFRVPLIDMRWENYAREQVTKGLNAFESSNFGHNFTMEFLLRFRSHYAFDDRALLRFLPADSPDTDDSAYDVSLLDFTAKIKSRFTQQELQANEKEKKGVEEKRKR